MLPWLPWRAVITGRNQETDALCLTKNIISWVLLASLSHHVSLAVVRDPGLPRPGSGSCMSGWVKPWAAPVQPCLPGWLSIVLCTGQPGCWEDFLIALGMGALPRAPRGPNFRDDRLLAGVASNQRIHAIGRKLGHPQSASMTHSHALLRKQPTAQSKGRKLLEHSLFLSQITH